jgi:hypothetical protein
MDPIVVTNIVVSTLLFLSEALPFIRSNDYNGLLDMVIKFVGRLKKDGPK